MVEHDSWEKKKNLENTKEIVTEFERRMNAEIKQQEKLVMAEERDFRREKILGKYMAKMLYR